MGIPKSRSLRTHTPIISSMKFLVILALAVAVSAEADPQLMYNTYGAGWPITSYVQKPLVSSYVKPMVYTKPVVYHAASPGVSHTVLKREAEPYHHVMRHHLRPPDSGAPHPVCGLQAGHAACCLQAGCAA